MKNKIKLLIIILCVLFLLALFGTLFFFYYWLPLESYNAALAGENRFSIYSTIDAYGDVLGFKDSRENIEKLAKYLFDENYHIQWGLTARIDDDGKIAWKYVYEKSYNKEKNNIENWNNVKDVAFLTSADSDGSFDNSFFALLKSGEVIHTQLHEPKDTLLRDLEQEFVDSEWTDIVKISNSPSHIVGLKKDGTVVSAGNTSTGQCDTDTWADIIDIAAGEGFTVGLKKDGRIVMAINNTMTKLNFEEGVMIPTKVGKYNTAELLETVYTWKNIKKISAGINHVVGLTEDGKVVVAGQNRFGQLNIGDWTNIVDVYATEMTTLALDNSGKVYFTERAN